LKTNVGDDILRDWVLDLRICDLTWWSEQRTREQFWKGTWLLL
jgi:hypothetical protein